MTYIIFQNNNFYLIMVIFNYMIVIFHQIVRQYILKMICANYALLNVNNNSLKQIVVTIYVLNVIVNY